MTERTKNTKISKASKNFFDLHKREQYKKKGIYDNIKVFPQNITKTNRYVKVFARRYNKKSMLDFCWRENSHLEESILRFKVIKIKIKMHYLKSELRNLQGLKKKEGNKKNCIGKKVEKFVGKSLAAAVSGKADVKSAQGDNLEKESFHPFRDDQACWTVFPCLTIESE